VERASGSTVGESSLAARRRSLPVTLNRLPRAALLSACFLLALCVIALAAPLITDASPVAVNPGVRLQAPSATHWLGTDDLGRDEFARLLYGARISLLVGAITMIGSAVLGTVLGLIAGYYYRFDNLIMRVLDGLMAFPAILLAIAITTSIGPSLGNVVVALVVVYAPVIARVVRSSALVNKRRLYVISARAVGVSDFQILRRYVLANSVSPLIVQCTFVVAYAIIAEASLSFLGAGVDPETATWGNMLRDGQRLIARAWWLWLFPGAVLVVTVLSLNLLGDGLRDVFDPRSAGSHRVGRWR
jgi:peptide/nickel transport system permease protein